MEMYQKCDADVASGALLEMYHQDCNTTAARTACMPIKATPTMNCDANQLVELYTKCATGGQLQEMYMEANCTPSGVKTQACQPVVPEGQNCQENYLMEMYMKCDDALLDLHTSGAHQLLEMYQEAGHAQCVQAAQDTHCTPNYMM